MVQRALLEDMPLAATVRQLSRLARLGMLTPMGEVEALVVNRIMDTEAILRSRAHPMLFLDALAVHASGGRGGLSRGGLYSPNQSVIDALAVAFAEAFPNVVPAGNRNYVAIDVSGSMAGAACVGSNALRARDAAGALALIIAQTEPQSFLGAFQRQMVELRVTRSTTLNEMLRATSSFPHFGTDCAQPILHAAAEGIEVDMFTILTDSETWAGPVHVTEALRQYRERSGIAARCAVVGMSSNGFSIADPLDSGMLDVVGMSTSTPGIISAFSRGDV